ncbi:uncharacterized protein N0V89_008010 [Didymosphaeria variabile]|uniref:Uncharacterized protein n=1 Tax=Didymosphaeria variabile TaxID=1932322 RepID=A0A9W8XF60_9PLEO|nr:uncharacterized protein N0V89_008010 [Didymosphaeria variabile]KAJ4349395.1 hypothetical protein N0V89_008010 [Didymosphaeria variabile]
MLSAVLRMVHFLIVNIIGCLVLIAIFVHEPTFKAIHEALFYVHIAARFAFLYLRLQFRYLIANSTDLTTWLASYGREVLVFSAPALRPVLPWATRFGTQTVHLSPRFLCYVNGGVVEAGKYVVDVVMGKDAGELKDMWKAVGKEVAGFCKADSKIWAAVGL